MPLIQWSTPACGGAQSTEGCKSVVARRRQGAGRSSPEEPTASRGGRQGPRWVHHRGQYLFAASCARASAPSRATHGACASAMRALFRASSHLAADAATMRSRMNVKSCVVLGVHVRIIVIAKNVYCHKPGRIVIPERTLRARDERFLLKCAPRIYVI